MKSKLLINIQDGQVISVFANGAVECHVHNLDTLDGIQQVGVKELTIEQMDQLIARGDEPLAPRLTAAEHNAFPNGRWS